METNLSENPHGVTSPQVALGELPAQPSAEAQTFAKDFCALNPSVSEAYMAKWFDNAMSRASMNAALQLRGEVLTGAKEPAWVGVMRDMSYQLLLVDNDKLRGAEDGVLNQALVQALELIAPFEK